MRRVLLACTLLSLAAAGCGADEEQSAGAPDDGAWLSELAPAEPDFVLGEPAPDFRLVAALGREAPGDSLVSLSDHRGQVVYLNFWNTGCRPCVAEKETLDELAEEYDGRVVFLGISSLDSAGTLASFAARHGAYRFPQLLDPGATASRAYAAEGRFPVHVVVDTAGRVAWWRPGGPIAAGTLRSVLDDVRDGRRPTAATTAAYLAP